MHASIPTIYISLVFYMFFLFLYSFFSFFLPLLPFVLPLFIVKSYPFLYHLPLWDLLFLPFNYFYLLMGVLPRLSTGLLAAQPLPLLKMCWLHHSPFLDKITCLIFYLSLFSLHSSRYGLRFLIKWSQPIFTSFGWDDIPTEHFSPKKLE